MRNEYKIWLALFVVIGFVMFLSAGCKKEADDDDYLNNVKDSVTDLDGNVYHTVIIGKQVWMVEYLKATHYRNGDPIPTGHGASEWSNLTTGAYCNYENDENNSSEYGRLYNWFAATDPRNIAPEGWHIPDEEEWGTLIALLSRDYYNKVLSSAINDTGLNIFPGFRADSGTFNSHGLKNWWSSSESDDQEAWYTSQGYDYQLSRNSSNKKYGYYLRCIRD